jgi:hypothetical protein
MEMTDSDKHVSLIRYGVNFRRKKYFDAGAIFATLHYLHNEYIQKARVFDPGNPFQHNVM